MSSLPCNYIVGQSHQGAQFNSGSSFGNSFSGTGGIKTGGRANAVLTLRGNRGHSRPE